MDGRIRAREVRVVDSDGGNLGVMQTRDAVVLAMRKGLNLVEIAPTAQPPVCRIVDFGKFRYEMSKREKESRKHQHANKLKEVEFHVNISDHDYKIKVHHAEEWLQKGCKVKACVTFRGREMAHQEFGKALIQRFVKDCSLFSTADSIPRMMGRRLNVLLSPLPAARRKQAASPGPSSPSVPQPSEPPTMAPPATPAAVVSTPPN